MSFPNLNHERVVTSVGVRSRLPITVAVHSTTLGPALGGCRLWSYKSWEEGLADAMRLSAAMTLKCAVAGLETGGGKSVIAMSPGETLTSARRRDGLLDLGDIVESLGGSYRTAEDVGTSTHDMLVVRERTDHVVGMPAEMGGLGEPAEPTAIGVYSAIETTVRRLGLDLRGLRVTIAGLGQVGSRLARALTLDGAVLSVTDLNPQRKELANELNATWIDLEGALTRSTDLLIPAGIGGC